MPAWHAAALAHLGRVDEARTVCERFVELAMAEWAGANPPARSDIAAWLLDCFPIRNADAWTRLRDGLSLAGLPVPDRLPADGDGGG